MSTVVVVVMSFLLMIIAVRVMFPETYSKIEAFRDVRVNDFWQSLDEISLLTDDKETATRSFSQKLAEGRDATAYMQKQAPIFYYVLGMGNGAEYPALSGSITSRVTSNRGEDFNHQIHNLFYGVLFRLGIVGLLMVLLFLGALVYGLHNAWRNTQGPNKVIIGGLLLGSCGLIVRQFSITDMFWNPGYVIFLGLGAQLIRYEFAKRREITATAAPEGTQLRSEFATGAG